MIIIQTFLIVNIERMLMVILILTYCLITCTRYRTVITIMNHKMLRYCTLKVLHNSLHLKIDNILCPDFGMVGHVVFTTRSYAGKEKAKIELCGKM